MKKYLLLFILCSNFLFSQINIPNDFKKIPDSLEFRDNLYRQIVPYKNFNYWRVVRKYDSFTEEILYENQDSKNINYLNNLASEEGFFPECDPDWCFSYITGYQYKKPQYFKNENDLRQFIGFVDNLAEALLIARTFDFWFDGKEIVGGSFKIDKNYFYLYLAKFESCPVSKESFFVKINRTTGELTSMSNGTYYRNDNCYTS